MNYKNIGSIGIGILMLIVGVLIPRYILMRPDENGIYLWFFGLIAFPTILILYEINKIWKDYKTGRLAASRQMAAGSEVELLDNDSQNGLPPQKTINKKFIAFVIVLVIIFASVSYALLYNPPINPNDPNFYNRYPTTPYDLGYLKIESSTLLWGNYPHDYVQTATMLTVQITPTIQDLANGFKESHPEDIVQQAKAAYEYVAEEIDYRDSVVYEGSYPVTTLTTKEGVCADYASLLASLLYALGLEDVAIVFTAEKFNGTTFAHLYVAVKIPSYSLPQNSVQEKIESYLGEGWIGLDPTNSLSGKYCDFAELDPTWELHWNITTIVGVPVYGAVFTLDLNYGHDYFQGYYLDFECELYAFEHGLDNDVTFTFELRENNVTLDREVINVTCGQDSLTKVYFILGCIDVLSVDDFYDTAEIYLIITP